MLGFGKQPSGGRAPAKPSGPIPMPPVPKLTLEKLSMLDRFRKRAVDINIPGKIWNAPNTVLGLQLGALGYVAGAATGRRPGVRFANNAVQFTNNPLGGVSAVTIGDTTISNGDPYDAFRSTGRTWFNPDGSPRLENGHTQQAHEEQHTKQGELLGPLYLPSNIAGGLYSLAREREWHGESNWNEAGPMSAPPQPWRKSPR